MKPTSVIAAMTALCGLTLLLPRPVAADPSDYTYGSMGWYNETESQNAFQGYMDSGNLNADTSVDVSDLKAKFAQMFAPDPPSPREDDPMDPPAGAGDWDNYWETYTPPAPVDTRTEEQKLTDAANDGNPVAMWNLAGSYLSGLNGCDKDTDRAILWYEKDARAGQADAAYELFCIYDPDWFAGGDNEPSDRVQAMYWLKEAAKGKDLEAMETLGDRYLKGVGVDVDVKEGLRLLQASLDGGHDAALISLFYAYDAGWGVPQDKGKAIGYAREMVKRNMGLDMEANLAELLLQTDDPKTHANAAEINALFAAHPDVITLCWLHAGVCENGLLGPRDPKAAMALYEKIIADGSWHLHVVQGMLADHYYTGDGCDRDPARAFALYRQAFADDKGADKQPQTRLNHAEMLASDVKQRQDDGTLKDVSDPAQAFTLAKNAYDGISNPAPLRAKAAMLCAWVGAHHPDVCAGDADHAPTAMARAAVALDDNQRVAWQRGQAERLWDAPAPSAPETAEPLGHTPKTTAPRAHAPAKRKPKP